MSMLEWAAIGAAAIALFAFSARAMRRGITTLDDDRRQHEEHLIEVKRQMEEDRKNISAADQLALLNAALKDWLRLESASVECELRPTARGVDIATPKGTWRAELVMQEISLRSTHKVLHGKCRWLLQSGPIKESHDTLGSLMASLNNHFHAVNEEQPMPEHIARRVAAARASMRLHTKDAPRRQARSHCQYPD